MFMIWKDYDESETLRVSDVTSAIDFHDTVCEFWGILLNDPDRESLDDIHTIGLSHIVRICDEKPDTADLQ